MLEKKYTIEGMNCQHCVKAVEVELGVLKLENYDVEIGSANIRFDESIVNSEDIIKAIDEAGFKVITE